MNVLRKELSKMRPNFMGYFRHFTYDGVQEEVLWGAGRNIRRQKAIPICHKIKHSGQRKQ